MATDNLKTGDKYALKQKEKNKFKKTYETPTKENFKTFVVEQQQEFLVKAFGSTTFDQQVMDGANASIKKSWLKLNEDLKAFGKEFEAFASEVDVIVDTTQQQLTQLQSQVTYVLDGFSENAKKLGDFDKDGLELPPQYKDFLRKSGLARWAFGSHKQAQYLKAMRNKDVIMTAEDKRQLLSIYGVQIAQAYDSATKIV